MLDRLRAESKIAEAIYGVPGILLESHGYLRSRPRLRALDREGSALYRADVGVGSKKEWGYWIRTPDGRIEKVWLPGQPKPPAGGRWKHVEVEL